MTPAPYDAVKHMATCQASVAKCETAEHIERVRAWAYFKISQGHATRGDCAADNTAVLGMISERQRQLGITCQCSHEDELESRT